MIRLKSWSKIYNRDCKTRPYLAMCGDVTSTSKGTSSNGETIQVLRTQKNIIQIIQIFGKCFALARRKCESVCVCVIFCDPFTFRSSLHEVKSHLFYSKSSHARCWRANCVTMVAQQRRQYGCQKRLISSSNRDTRTTQTHTENFSG